VAVEGIIVRRLGVQHELGSVAEESPSTRCSRSHMEPWFTLAGAFDLRQSIDLAAASASVAMKPP